MALKRVVSCSSVQPSERIGEGGRRLGVVEGVEGDRARAEGGFVFFLGGMVGVRGGDVGRVRGAWDVCGELIS